MDKIRIAIADDHTLVRQTIARALAHDKKLEVVAQAEDGKVLVDLVEKVRPDIIILDIEMPVMDGFQVLDHLKFHYPQARVIILSMHFENLIIKDLVNRGARGFLPKNSDFESLLNAVYEVMGSGYFFSKRINANLVQELLDKHAIHHVVAPRSLSDNERLLLDLICHDNSTKEIARIMRVTERTVERYKAELYKKTAVKTIAGLVLYAVRNGLFSPAKHLGP